eukprot:1161696-Pelagomonas_calceolata.AAC.30
MKHDQSLRHEDACKGLQPRMIGYMLSNHFNKDNNKMSIAGTHDFKDIFKKLAQTHIKQVLPKSSTHPWASAGLTSWPSKARRQQGGAVLSGSAAQRCVCMSACQHMSCPTETQHVPDPSGRGSLIISTLLLHLPVEPWLARPPSWQTPFSISAASLAGVAAGPACMLSFGTGSGRAWL